MKRGTIAIALLFILLTISFGNAITEMTVCPDSSVSSNTHYNITQDMTAGAGAKCFYVSAKTNITFDCNGFKTIGDAGVTANVYGAHVTGSSDITFNNCVFSNWTGTAFSVLTFTNAENNTFNNVSLNDSTGPFVIYKGYNNTVNGYQDNSNTYLKIYGNADARNHNLYNGNGRLTSWSSDAVSPKIINWTISNVAAGQTLYGTGLYIENLTMTNITAGDILITADNSFFKGVTYQNSTTRFRVIDTNNITLDNFLYSNINYTNIASLYLYASDNITINNSNFYDSTSKGYAYSSGDDNVTGLIIENTRFDNFSFDFNSVVAGNLKNVSIFDGLLRFYDTVGLNAINLTIDNNGSFQTNGRAGGNGISRNVLVDGVEDIGGSNSEYVIKIYNTTNFTVTNVNLDLQVVSGANSQCIRADTGANDGRIFNNTCLNASHGILLNGASNNIDVFNNTVIGASFGYLFEFGAYNNTIRDNYMDATVFYSLHNTHDNTAYGNTIIGRMVLHDNVTNEYFYNNTVTGNLIFEASGSYGNETGAYNNIIESSTFSGLLNLSNSSDNTLINVSWEGETDVDSIYPSSFTAKYYLDVLSNINNTNITITNSTGAVSYSGIIDESIPRQSLLSYINIGGTQTNYSNYTISASASGYVTQTNEINLTDGTVINFTLVAVAITAEETSAGAPSYTANEKRLAEGYTKFLRANWKLKFEIEDDKHELQVSNFDTEKNSSIVSIYSEKQSKLLSIGETWNVELSGDEYYDLFVRLDKVTASGASIFVQEIHEKMILSTDSVVSNETDVQDEIVVLENEEDENLILYYVLLGIIILTILVLIFRKKIFILFNRIKVNFIKRK